MEQDVGMNHGAQRLRENERCKRGPGLCFVYIVRPFGDRGIGVA
jgi:hypothetical protein